MSILRRLRPAALRLALSFAALPAFACVDGGVAPDQDPESFTGPPIELTTSRLPPALVGGSYDVGVETEEPLGPEAVWSIESGDLPAGLELTVTGRIRGTPVAAGTWSFTVAVRTEDRRGSLDLTLDVLPHDRERYDLLVFGADSLSPSFREKTERAVARWAEVVAGDLTAAFVPRDFFGGEDCGGRGAFLNGTTIDDLAVLIRVDSIDGAGRVAARAGPCALRDDLLPLVGIITLDEPDMKLLKDSDRAVDLMIHEMAHVLGFGAIWSRMELIEGADGDDPRFTGPEAVGAYRALGGEGDVPVEAEGGEGTVHSHWRESVFGDEVMTGFAAPEGVPQPLSAVTIGSMADLGYVVDMAAADPYTLPSAPRGTSTRPVVARDEVLRGPVRVLLPDGRGITVPLRERP